MKKKRIVLSRSAKPSFIKVIQTLLFLLFSGFVIPQNNSYETLILQKSRFAFVTELKNNIAIKTSADTSNDIEHYRLWLNYRQVVDIWQGPNGNCNGLLISWVEENLQNSTTRRIFIKTTSLNSDTAKIIKQLFYSSGVFNLPSSNKISGWWQGMDGYSYSIEHIAKGNSSSTFFWMPEYQDSLKAAKLILSFANSVFELTHAELIANRLIYDAPCICFHAGGAMSGCKGIESRKKERIMKKENKIYLNQPQDGTQLSQNNQISWGRILKAYH